MSEALAPEQFEADESRTNQRIEPRGQPWLPEAVPARTMIRISPSTNAPSLRRSSGMQPEGQTGFTRRCPHLIPAGRKAILLGQCAGRGRPRASTCTTAPNRDAWAPSADDLDRAGCSRGPLQNNSSDLNYPTDTRRTSADVRRSTIGWLVAGAGDFCNQVPFGWPVVPPNGPYTARAMIRHGSAREEFVPPATGLRAFLNDDEYGLPPTAHREMVQDANESVSGGPFADDFRTRPWADSHPTNRAGKGRFACRIKAATTNDELPGKAPLDMNRAQAAGAVGVTFCP